MIWDILQESSFNDYFVQGKVETLTPQKLLLDQNIITEFKNLNPKLMEQQIFKQVSVQGHYDEFLSRLIDYTVKLPEENDGQDRVRKLPYVSSEVLAIDNQTVYKAFFDWPKDYFQQLVGIFDTEAKNNQILSGYFVKILQNLYKCQKKKVPYLLVQTAHKIYLFRQVFFQNLDKESVSTVFTLFLVLLQTEEGSMINQRKQVVQKLIQQLVTANQNIKNVCKNVLVQVISKFQTFSSGDQLLKEILHSQKLPEIFQIKNSKAIDQFLVGYMTKALQKICTSGNQKKSLLEISETHKDGIKKYILSRNYLLKIDQLSGFNNQSKTKVYRLDKKVSFLLTLIKLAMENSIIGLIHEEEIQALFNIVKLHPSNDIVKVKIFDIFGLIYTKKDINSQQIFGKYFYVESIELFEKNKQMFGPFLFQLWKIVHKKITNHYTQPQNQSRWTLLVKYFQQLENYQKQAQKVVDRYSNLTKVTKIVVDEEDTAPSSQPTQKTSQGKLFPIQSAINTIRITDTHVKNQETKLDSENYAPKPQNPNTTSNDPFSFDFFASTDPISKSQNKQQTKPKEDPFAAFNFFSPKNTQSQPTKKQENKKSDFNDFSSFF